VGFGFSDFRFVGVKGVEGVEGVKGCRGFLVLGAGARAGDDDERRRPGRGFTFVPRAPGAPHAVHVVLQMVRGVVVEDQPQILPGWRVAGGGLRVKGRSL
jgi:hypothetical protein